MSKKRRPIEGWLCVNNTDAIGQTYIRLTSDLLRDQRFTALPHLAQLVYLHMCMAAAGRIEFMFPYSVYSCFCSKGGFAKAEKALVNGGFIEKVESGRTTREPNKYRFSVKWKS